VLSIVTAFALVGCGDEATEAADAASPTASAPTTTTHSRPGASPEPSATTERPDQDTVEVEIEIEDGEVSPAGAQVDAAVGDEVQLQVDSDTLEELHVHSAPTEHDYAVRAKSDQEFSFTVEQPGQFDVELHESGVLVAQLVVRP